MAKKLSFAERQAKLILQRKMQTFAYEYTCHTANAKHVKASECLHKFLACMHGWKKLMLRKYKDHSWLKEVM